MLKPLSQFLERDLYKNVLQLDSHFRICITNQLVGQKEYRVDNGLVAICTCRGLLKTAKLPKIDYLCSFTVAHPVQIFLMFLGSPGFYLLTIERFMIKHHLDCCQRCPLGGAGDDLLT